MKSSILVLTTAIAVTLSHSVFAERQAAMPPPGPYKAMSDVGQYSPNQFVHNNNQKEDGYNYESTQYRQPSSEMPEWVKRRQAQMQQQMQQGNMPQMQHWNEPRTQWYKEQQQLVPPAYQGTGYAPNMQSYRMQQTVPVTPRPVFDPRTQPRESYRPPGYPAAQY